MNKTLRMLLHIQKKRKNKTTYLNWKTFNSKQTWIHAPKILNVLHKINSTLENVCAKQVNTQHAHLLSAINNIENISNTYNKKSEYFTKHNVFSSAFATTYINVVTLKTLNVQNNAFIKIGANYTTYLLLLNMYNNVKNVKNTIVTLPSKRTAYTVLKSPHADKKAREQFMKELFNVRISIKNYIALMQYMNSIVLSYTKAFIHSYKYNAFYNNKI